MAKRIVLDTNALLVSIGRKSRFRPVYDAFLDEKFILIISNEIINEYIEKIEEKTNASIAQNIGEAIIYALNIQKQDIWFNFNLINNDFDDNKFVDCAIAGNAAFIVTNDNHFKVLKDKFPKVEVISIEVFLTMIENNQL
jgi:uncharacterized protein